MVACNRRRNLGLGRAGGGAAAPCPPPLPGGLLAGPGLLPRWCSAQIGCVGGLLLVFFLCALLKIRVPLCAFFSIFIQFHSIPGFILQNMFYRNTSGTRLIVYAYVLKFAYFSCFGLDLAVLNVQ